MRTLLGLGPLDDLTHGRRDESLRLTADDTGQLAWPGAAEVKAAVGVDRAAIDSVLQRARARWLKQPAITQTRNDLVAILERAGGVLSGEELALGLLAQRGSTATG